jgi:hypothetical protein
LLGLHAAALLNVACKPRLAERVVMQRVPVLRFAVWNSLDALPSAT